MRHTSKRRRSESFGGQAFTSPASAPRRDRREQITLSGSANGKVILECPDCGGQVGLKKAVDAEGECWPTNPSSPRVRPGDLIFRKHREGGGNFNPRYDHVICIGYGKRVEL